VTGDGTIFEGSANTVCRGPDAATTAAASAAATHTRTTDRSPRQRPILLSNFPLARSSYEPGSPERSRAELGIAKLAGGGEPAGDNGSSAGIAGGVEG
jgi:hypothetical protein